MSLDTERIRRDFPALRLKVRGRPPIYLDSACTTLRPEPVIRAMADFQCRAPTCHGRTSHFFGQQTTRAYEGAREVVRGFLGAASSAEVVFVRNTTEAINLVAASFPWKRGDEVLTTRIEHNSNLMPWRRLSARGVTHRTLPVDLARGFDMAAFREALSPRVRMVAVPQVSNLCGILLPVREIVQAAHAVGAKVLVDGAQAVTTHAPQVAALGVDFYAFSFHKAFGPGGIGALYGKREALEMLSPFLVGGGMVAAIDDDGVRYEPLPDRLEAGVCNYDGAVGGAAAIKWLQSIGGQPAVLKHVVELNRLATEGLASLPRLQILGPRDPAARGAVLSFYVEGVESEAIARLLDTRVNVMVRHGKLCVHEFFRHADPDDAVRVSFSVYNTPAEVRTLVGTVRNAVMMLA